ncbi:MAG: UDP-N-acetylmuramate--L-alanine ligase [Lachnospiraceae bacterium]|nr:UDP-N-acetylmuramate--L-alanine ligase [Lachnospiraceae bacterium]
MYEIDFQKPIHVHFIGIGGISMSGLAVILLKEGFTVSGSDNKESELTEELRARGATVFIGQRTDNITSDIDLVVYSAAIRRDNPEFGACVESNLPMLSRAELLGQMMRNYGCPIAISGTHGKTTTSTMAGEILMANDTDPTLSIGGMVRSIGGNIRIGSSDYFLTEACEYTNSFLSFFPRYGVIMNIEADHLDFFKDLDDIRNSFHKFALLLPADGALIINGEIENLAEITADVKSPVITFGINKNCDYYATDITYNASGCPAYKMHAPDGSVSDVTLGVVGKHNVYNSLAALALSDVLGFDREKSLKSLTCCVGADRRFQIKGHLGDITVVDDYAHHPTEIAATLAASANYPHKETWCVFQPHTYSRTKALLEDFAEALKAADHVVLADIYAARETDTLGISSKNLQEEIIKRGGDCHYFHTFSEIEIFLLQSCNPGDLLITMGAGDVYRVGEELLGN